MFNDVSPNDFVEVIMLCCYEPKPTKTPRLPEKKNDHINMFTPRPHESNSARWLPLSKYDDDEEKEEPS